MKQIIKICEQKSVKVKHKCRKAMKLKAASLKILKIDETLASLIGEKEKHTSNIRNEKLDIYTDFIDINRINRP